MSDIHNVKVLNRGLRAFGQVQAKLLGYIENKNVGGTVTQATNRSTTVTINKPTGVITTSDASLAAGAEVSFRVNNSEVKITDVVVIAIQNDGATGTMTAYVADVDNGFFRIMLSNLNATTASTSPVVINFAIIRGSSN